MTNKCLTKSIATLMTFTTLNVFAHVAYITDSVDIPMRSANKIQSNPSNLVRMLPSDTKLQLLTTDSGWSQVVTANGTVGWVVSRYVTSTTPARVKLEAREQLIKSLVKQNKKLRVELETMTNKLMAELGVL